uniref:Photosystem II cytochrome c550 n=1 Tax=Bornetia secundiflora TaxID=2575637 RepID=A0A4D6WLJ0_9FLOR|nr:photosystem II cytochrome c550 [Bornetia secundiflora]
MIKKHIFLSCFSCFVLLNFILSPIQSIAIELDDNTRTVQLNESGKTTILTKNQAKRGRKLFNNNCAQCHNGGITKTNPNIGLEQESLSLATPSRDHIEGLVDYMKSPTSYDGTTSIAENHPSIKSADIFPKMRNLTDEDLSSIAGYILMQTNIASDKWGGGKIYY